VIARELQGDTDPLVDIGPDTLSHLAAFVAAHGLRRLHLVADAITWSALGQQAASVLAGSGCSVRPVILPGSDVAADEGQIMQVMLAADPAPQAYLAVGSGTITDITRFASHRLGRPFISLPTAPSVDAYTSDNAPLVIRGLKRTIPAQTPIAVFADIDTLCRAPAAMVAAGFGDMLGKYTCLADWRLGHLLWDEPYDADVAAHASRALEDVAALADAIGVRAPDGIAALMRGLCASGTAIARLGSSASASGSEHHLSHYWEMRLLREGRPPLLHGAKVGAATVLMAASYARLRALSRGDVQGLLRAAPEWTVAAQEKEIREAYRDLAEGVVADHRPFLTASTERSVELRRRIVDRWDEVLAIAATVPEPGGLAHLLARAGGASRPEALGLSSDEVSMARRHAHYLRNRFTVRKLEIALGLTIEGEAA
jgi:glycerol-1-phosphate dehydrogenase [NAD(P)+]